MPHWKGAALSGSKSIELEESPGTPLGGLSSSDDGSFLCVYSGSSTTVDPGSDRSLQFDLEAEDEAGLQVYNPTSGITPSLGFDSIISCSGSFTFRVKALGTGARLRATWIGTTSLGEDYQLEVTLTRLPQPAQPIPHVIT